MARQAVDALEPGELLVKVVRGELILPPDHIAIAKANRAIREYGQPAPGDYEHGAPNARQQQCLEGIDG